MIRKSLLLFLLVSVNACQDVCVNPGDGVSTNSIDVEVPVYISGALASVKSDWWIDSGIDIDSDETTPLVVNKTINLCADTLERIENCTNPKLCSRTVVPSTFCSDGSVPRYNINSGEYDAATVCSHSEGRFSSDGFYVDSNILVKPGDQLEFRLVPHKIVDITNCYNIPPEVSVYSFSDLEKIYLDATGKLWLSNDDRAYIQNVVDNKMQVICEQGIDFVEVKNTGNYIHLPAFKGSYPVYVSNDFTPYGNKNYHFDINKFDEYNNWNNAAILDVRTVLKGDHYKYECRPVVDQDLLRFNTYEVNNYCEAICSETKGPPGCMNSLRYKWGIGSQECINAMNAAGDDPRKCRMHTIPEEKWADQIVAKIGGLNNNYGDSGELCLPNQTSGRCIGTNNKPSIRLDYKYFIPDYVTPSSKVWLGIPDTGVYADNVGGYHMEVRRTCLRANGEDLYMYIGNSTPDIDPGDIDTYHLHIPPQDADSNGVTELGVYTVNGGGADGKSNPPKNGRIYFGIKGARESDTVKEGFIEKPNENKYTISVTKVQWNPIFSSFFTLIRDSILNVLYGDPAGGSIKEIGDIDINNTSGLIASTYTKIINNGLLQFVQTVLVLYLALTSMGFMIGLIQKTQAEFMIRVVKIGVILAAVSPGSWELFGGILFSLFVFGVDQLAGIFSGIVGSDTTFAFLDPTMGVLLTKETWLRFVSIMFSGPVGFVSFLLLLWGVWVFIGCVINATIVHLLSIIAMSLLLILAPLFIIALLFKVTKTLFDGWIKMMVSISLTNIILFTSLGFLHQVMMAAFASLVNFAACPGCLFTMKFNIGVIPFHLCPIKTLLPTTYVSEYGFNDHLDQLYATSGENVFGLPFNLVALIMFVLTVFAMRQFVEIADNMAKAITESMEPNLTMAAAGRGGASQGLLSLVGQDNETKRMRAQALMASNVDPTKINVEKRKGVEHGDHRNIKENSDEEGGVDPEKTSVSGREYLSSVVPSAPLYSGSEDISNSATDLDNSKGMSDVAEDIKGTENIGNASNVEPGSAIDEEIVAGNREKDLVQQSAGVEQLGETTGYVPEEVQSASLSEEESKHRTEENTHDTNTQESETDETEAKVLEKTRDEYDLGEGAVRAEEIDNPYEIDNYEELLDEARNDSNKGWQNESTEEVEELPDASSRDNTDRTILEKAEDQKKEIKDSNGSEGDT